LASLTFFSEDLFSSFTVDGDPRFRFSSSEHKEIDLLLDLVLRLSHPPPELPSWPALSKK
jgi:hypothetical protein